MIREGINKNEWSGSVVQFLRERRLFADFVKNASSGRPVVIKMSLESHVIVEIEY